MSSQTSTLPTTSLSEEDVENYLRSHPSFFEEREALLEQMRLPHHASGAVSLVERQIRVLRKKNQESEQQLSNLIKAAQANETLSSRMHQLALALLSANDLNDVLSLAKTQMIQAFKADKAIVKLLDDKSELNPYPSADRTECLSLFEEAYKSNRAVCGRLTPRQQDYLFEDDTHKILSSVFVPLSHHTPLGYLVLGSHDPNRFHAGMGTLFLGYLGELVTHAIIAHQPQESRAS